MYIVVLCKATLDLFFKMDVGEQFCCCSCQFLLLFCWWWSLLLNHLESPYERASRNGNVPMKRHSATNIIQVANDPGMYLYLDGNVRLRHKTN